MSAETDAFNYLAVLFSVVLGLALTQILQGLRALMIARSRVKLYWPALIQTGMILLIITQSWWSMFSMREIPHWTFAMYAMVLLQVTLIYLIAGLALPDVAPTGVVDLRESYYAHSRWFFGLLAAAVIVSLTKEVILTGRLQSRPNMIFHGAFLVAAVTAAITRNRWYHAALAPVTFLLFVSYIAVLFAQL